MRSSLINVTRAMAWATPLLLCLTGCLPATGGCPWTKTSAVELTPATDCLKVSVADASGRGDSTGCVDPVLVGENRCPGTFALPAAASVSGRGLRVEPGERFTFEVAFDTAIAEPHDRLLFALTGRLADESLTLRFRTWRN